MRRYLWGLIFVIALTGCDEDWESKSDHLQRKDFYSQWIRLALPTGDNLGQLESIVKTENGFSLLYRRPLGSGMEQWQWENRVYNSSEGLEWKEYVFPLVQSSRYYRDMAYGNGLLMLVGAINGNDGIVATSSNGSTFTHQQVETWGLGAVRFVEGYFYGLSTWDSLFRSKDGVDFQRIVTETAMLSDIAFGEGRYVAVGSGPIQISDDGVNFRSVSIDCSLPNACRTDPDGGLYQGYRSRVLYADGYFYTGGSHSDGFVSADGEHWEYQSHAPDEFFGGYLLRLEENGLLAWQPEDGFETHKRIELTDRNPDSKSCMDHRCVIIKNQLILIP